MASRLLPINAATARDRCSLFLNTFFPSDKIISANKNGTGTDDIFSSLHATSNFGMDINIIIYRHDGLHLSRVKANFMLGKISSIIRTIAIYSFILGLIFFFFLFGVVLLSLTIASHHLLESILWNIQSKLIIAFIGVSAFVPLIYFNFTLVFAEKMFWNMLDPPSKNRRRDSILLEGTFKAERPFNPLLPFIVSGLILAFYLAPGLPISSIMFLIVPVWVATLYRSFTGNALIYRSANILTYSRGPLLRSTSSVLLYVFLYTAILILCINIFSDRRLTKATFGPYWGDDIEFAKSLPSLPDRNQPLPQRWLPHVYPFPAFFGVKETATARGVCTMFFQSAQTFGGPQLAVKLAWLLIVIVCIYALAEIFSCIHSLLTNYRSARARYESPLLPGETLRNVSAEKKSSQSFIRFRLWLILTVAK